MVSANAVQRRLKKNNQPQGNGALLGFLDSLKKAGVNENQFGRLAELQRKPKAFKKQVQTDIATNAAATFNNTNAPKPKSTTIKSPKNIGEALHNLGNRKQGDPNSMEYKEAHANYEDRLSGQALKNYKKRVGQGYSPADAFARRNQKA